jgi:hypothetical protein
VVVHSNNSSTKEVEVGGSLVRGQPGLHNEFQVSLSYIAKPCQKKRKKSGRRKRRSRRKEGGGKKEKRMRERTKETRYDLPITHVQNIRNSGLGM